ncbi:MAG: chromosome partitioning protein, partial [Pseudomonadota bacterium]
MGTDRPESLPPYFNIDPDIAAASLGATTDVGGLDAMARACAAGRSDLESRGLDEAGTRQLRLFSTWEITRYLI